MSAYCAADGQKVRESSSAKARRTTGSDCRAECHAGPTRDRQPCCVVALGLFARVPGSRFALSDHFAFSCFWPCFAEKVGGGRYLSDHTLEPSRYILRGQHDVRGHDLACLLVSKLGHLVERDDFPDRKLQSVGVRNCVAHLDLFRDDVHGYMRLPDLPILMSTIVPSIAGCY